MLALQSATNYAEMYGVPPEVQGDIDGSGYHDFDDIEGFVAIFRGSVPSEMQPIPEPSALALGIVGMIGILVKSRSRFSLIKAPRAVLLGLAVTCLCCATSITNAKSIGVNFVSDGPDGDEPQSEVSCCALGIFDVAGVGVAAQMYWNNTEPQPTVEQAGQTPSAKRRTYSVRPPVCWWTTLLLPPLSPFHGWLTAAGAPLLNLTGPRRRMKNFTKLV